MSSRFAGFDFGFVAEVETQIDGEGAVGFEIGLSAAPGFAHLVGPDPSEENGFRDAEGVRQHCEEKNQTNIDGAPTRLLVDIF